MIKRLGARGLLKPSTTAVQVIIGPEVELLANDIKEIIVSGVTIVGVQQGAPVARQVKSEQLIVSAEIQAQAEECCALLGGKDNINLVELAAETRVLVTLKNAQELDKDTLKQAGISGTMALSDGRIMLIAGTKAPELTQALQTQIA